MQDKTIIFHIGRHKSGTSSLQRYLTANATELANHSICYPNTGRKNRLAHHQIAAVCSLPSIDRVSVQRLRRNLNREIRSYDTTLISSEAFQNLKNKQILEHIVNRPKQKKQLKRVVICYIREYLDYALSSYAQSVQNTQMCMPFAQYFKKNFNVDIKKFTDDWKQFTDDLKLREFSKEKLYQNDIIHDFNKFCGLPQLEITKQDDANPSISGNLLAFKLRINALGLHDKNMYRILKRLAGEEAAFRGKIQVTDKKASELRDCAPKYNEDFAALIGDPTLRSFENGNKVLDPETWQRDLDFLYSDDALAKKLTGIPIGEFSFEKCKNFSV